MVEIRSCSSDWSASAVDIGSDQPLSGKISHYKGMMPPCNNGSSDDVEHSKIFIATPF